MEAILRKEIIVNKTLCQIIGALVFIILTVIGAFVRIPLPFTPVPITLQTFFVLLSGAVLGSNLGAVTQLSYLFLGISGLPIFSGAGSGLFYLLGPTGGYLFGFVLTSFFVGRFIKYSKNNLFLTFIIFCITALVILACGTFWLGFLFKYSFTKLLIVGFIPFVPGDLLKAGAAAILYLKLKARLKEIF